MPPRAQTVTPSNARQLVLLALFAVLSAALRLPQPAAAYGFGMPDTNTKTLTWKLYKEGLVGRDFTDFSAAVSQGGAESESIVYGTPFPHRLDYGTTKSRGRSTSSSIGLTDGNGFEGGSSAGAASTASSSSRGLWAPRWSYLKPARIHHQSGEDK